jgi:hypothetical protein
MSLASPERGRQSRSVSPRRSRRLAKQPPEIDAREAARARQRSASKANRQHSVNGMPGTARDIH